MLLSRSFHPHEIRAPKQGFIWAETYMDLSWIYMDSSSCWNGHQESGQGYIKPLITLIEMESKGDRERNVNRKIKE